MLSFLPFAVFSGFQNDNIRTVQVQTVEGGSVAMECDFLDAKPSPIVEWFMNNGTMPIPVTEDENQVLYLDGGRYLFIRVLTAEQRSSFFHCEVANAYLGTMPQRSPTTYSLEEDLPLGMLQVYRPVQGMTVIQGRPAVVVYAAASRRLLGASTIFLSCHSLPDGVSVSISNNVVAVFTGVVGAASNRRLVIRCQVVGTTLDPEPFQDFSFIVSRK